MKFNKKKSVTLSLDQFYTYADEKIREQRTVLKPMKPTGQLQARMRSHNGNGNGNGNGDQYPQSEGRRPQGQYQSRGGKLSDKFRSRRGAHDEQPTGSKRARRLAQQPNSAARVTGAKPVAKLNLASDDSFPSLPVSVVSADDAVDAVDAVDAKVGLGSWAKGIEAIVLAKDFPDPAMEFARRMKQKKFDKMKQKDKKHTNEWSEDAHDESELHEWANDEQTVQSEHVAVTASTDAAWSDGENWDDML